MISFEQELLGNRGFSPIPPDGLNAVIFANHRFLLPTKSVVAMLGSRVSLLYLSGMQRRKGGSGMLVISPQVGRKE